MISATLPSMQFDHATECARAAVQVARAANDTDATILGLRVQGLALASTGRYDEAWRVFDEASCMKSEA